MSYLDDRIRAISLAMGMVPIIWTRAPDGSQFDTNGMMFRTHHPAQIFICLSFFRLARTGRHCQWYRIVPNVPEYLERGLAA